jgi:predicted DNA-binding protein
MRWKMSIFNVIKKVNKDKRTETISFRFTKKNKDFLNVLSDTTGASKNEIINVILQEYQKEYENREMGDKE